MHTSQHVFLPIGKLRILTKPQIIWTVLGSCVSIVLFHRKSKFAAICHAQLPERGQKDYACRANCPLPCHHKLNEGDDFKYVTCSVNYMVSELNKLGVMNKDMLASIVGGSSMFNLKQEGKTIGEKNAEIAIQMLKEHKVNLLKQDIGGLVGRKLIFNSSNGVLDIMYQKRNVEYINFVKE